MRRLSSSLESGFRRASKLCTLLAESQYRRALLHRVAAAVEHDRTPFSHDYRTIIDVGANRGQFALVAARRFPRASLICFEPQQGPREVLARVMSRHPRLRVVDAALAARAGTSTLHITEADDSSSLLLATHLQLETFPGTQIIEQRQVTTQRLDALVRTADLVGPTLLKIDVQGTELEVLKGASDVLDCIESILVECSFVELYAGQALAHEVFSFLHKRGFRLAHMVSPTCDRVGVVLQADLTFERPANGPRMPD